MCLSSRLFTLNLVYVNQGLAYPHDSGDGRFTQIWPFLATAIGLKLDK